MTRILFVFAALIGAGMTSPAALAYGQGGTKVDPRDTVAHLAVPVRGDFEVPVDSLVRLLAVKRTVLAMDNQWRAAELRNDAVLLDSVLANDWTATQSTRVRLGFTNMVETKAHFLADVQSGERSYESIADSAIVVRIVGDAVVLTGSTTSKGYLKDQGISERSVFTRTYEKRLGRWQMITSHSTVLF
jgi:hypothetical protein